MEIPEQVKKGTDWIARDYGEERASLERTPESFGLSAARGVIQQAETQGSPPDEIPDGGHYGESFYVFPNIREALKESKK